MDETATHDAATEPTPPAQPTGAEPDPFAEIPSDPLGEGELPPGVAPGSLGGENPSAEQAERDAQAAAEAEADAQPPEEPLAEEPMGGEFLEEPPEAEDLGAEAELPPEPEPDAAPPVAEEPPTPEPEAEQPPAEEPVAGTYDTPPLEPATPVEGSRGSPLRGDPLGSDGSDVPPPAAPAPAEEPPPAPAPADDDPPPAPPADAEGGGEQPPAAAEPEPKPAKRKRKPRKKKAEKGRRGYVILRLNLVRTEGTVGGLGMPGWDEAFEREIPHGEEGSEPVTIDTRSGEMALRNAYRKLTENGEASMELVAIPAKLFNPKKVEGKVPDNALTIKVQ